MVDMRSEVRTGTHLTYMYINSLCRHTGYPSQLSSLNVTAPSIIGFTLPCNSKKFVRMFLLSICERRRGSLLFLKEDLFSRMIALLLFSLYISCEDIRKATAAELSIAFA